MPIDLKALQNKGATLEVEFYGETGEIVYDPTMFTPQFRTEYLAKQRELEAERQQLIRDAAEKAKAGKEAELPTPVDIARGNARLLTTLVKSWDIIGLDGKPLPVKEDAILEALPPAFMAHLIDEIWNDVRFLGKRPSTTSDN